MSDNSPPQCSSSTRVCFKNIPPRIDESQLKEHLISSLSNSTETKITITDVRILKTKQGKSRKVAFVGFENDELASLCVRKMHQTYLGMSKLSVENALPRGQHNNAAARNKLDDGRSHDDVDATARKIVSKTDPGIVDRKKQEFLSAMAPRHKKKFWQNDDLVQMTESTEHNQPEQALECNDEANEAVLDESNTISSKHVTKASISQEYKKHLSLSRLFVRNLPYSTTEEDLRDLFSSCAANVLLTEVHIPIDDNHRNKGYAFVEFDSKDHCKKAMETLDGVDFQGRLLHILPARDKPVNETDESGDRTYKQQKLLNLHKEALSTTIGHNASHLRTDTVVHSLADSLGVKKSDILSIEGNSMAVRVALGEAHVIEQNKAWCTSHGIDLEGLESANSSNQLTRSKTTILVKNLPYGDDSEEELLKLFGAYSDSVDVLMPPSKSLALIKYAHGNDAKKAFKKLAYKRFRHVPLYLEWAPVTAENMQTAISNDDEMAAQEKEAFIDEDEDEEVPTDVQRTVFVKNLNFTTTEAQLETHFARVVDVRAVTIPMKKAPEKNTAGESRMLSIGYGFVECSSLMEAKKAIKLLSGKVIDGHKLELKISSKHIITSSKEDTRKTNGKRNTKIMVRNVPFQATRTELVELFGSYGELKTVRLPKKFDGNLRGFAFIDFVTHNEAQNAMQSLAKIHLYGRHLVMDWAEQEDNVDDLREKAKRDINRANAVESKRQNKKIRFNPDE